MLLVGGGTLWILEGEYAEALEGTELSKMVVSNFSSPPNHLEGVLKQSTPASCLESDSVGLR